jgi:hypothetical protein
MTHRPAMVPDARMPDRLFLRGEGRRRSVRSPGVFQPDLIRPTARAWIGSMIERAEIRSETAHYREVSGQEINFITA